MSFARRSSIAAVAALTLLDACAGRSMILGRSSEAKAWPTTLAYAQEAIGRGRYDTADSTLVVFGDQHRGTDEALETTYWRAVYALDPANRGGSLTAAMTLLDSYLADRRPKQHLAEAAGLRRVAGQMEVLTRLAGAAPTTPDKPRDVAVATRPDSKPAEGTAADAAEIKRLKDELAKANAELERIRRRLATPPPGRR